MKYKISQSGIGLFLLVWLTYASPAFCLDQMNELPGAGKPESTDYTASPFNFLTFYQNQAFRLQSNMQQLLSLTGLNELLFKQIMITTEFSSHRHSAFLPVLPARFEYAGKAVMKTEASTDPVKQNSFANMYENLRSPILAPYKYKTTNNTMLSVILPIAATDQITIIPIVSYAFSMNGSEREDLKDKAIISPIDKQGAIIYGGINLNYSF